MSLGGQYSTFSMQGALVKVDLLNLTVEEISRIDGKNLSPGASIRLRSDDHSTVPESILRTARACCQRVAALRLRPSVKIEYVEYLDIDNRSTEQ